MTRVAPRRLNALNMRYVTPSLRHHHRQVTPWLLEEGLAHSLTPSLTVHSVYTFELELYISWTIELLLSVTPLFGAIPHVLCP